MRCTLISRSSLLKLRPFERCVRTTSPSSTSTFAPAARRRASMMPEMVLLPAPESPVNQSTKPLCTMVSQHFLEQHVDGALDSAVGGEVDAALFVGILFPPPPPGPLALPVLHAAGAGGAARAGAAGRGR